MKNMWQRIPEQIRHIVVPAVVLIVLYLVVRHLFVPPTFGLWGHYRAASVVQNAEMPIRYAGSVACTDCHGEIVAAKKTGFHRGVACEACHGPIAAHVEDPEKIKPQVLRTRAHCLLCHEYLPARPTGFPQVVSDSHNPLKPCIGCHRPHDPKPPQTPKGCDACHQTIHRILALSHHGGLECTTCHQVPKDHKIAPRANSPQKLQTREACGSCHAKDAKGPKEIPRVDMATHGEKYLCWECHYPHMPEAR